MQYAVWFGVSLSSYRSVHFPVFYTESRWLAVSGSHDAECSGEGETRAEAGCSGGRDGLHPHGAEQTLGRPAARRLVIH